MNYFFKNPTYPEQFPILKNAPRLPLSLEPPLPSSGFRDNVGDYEEFVQYFEHFKQWLIENKNIYQPDAQAVARELEYFDNSSFTRNITAIIGSEAGFNHFLYWYMDRVEYSASKSQRIRDYRTDAFIAKMKMIPSDIFVADLNFHCLQHKPLSELKAILLSIPEHVETIDFSYNVFKEGLDDIAQALVDSGREILLDECPMSWDLGQRINQIKENNSNQSSLT